MPELYCRSALDEGAMDDIRELEERLIAFYRQGADSGFFSRAEDANVRWVAESPHGALRDAVQEDMRILDLGCGSAHADRHLRSTGATYFGVDVSEPQLRINAKVGVGSDRLSVASLYALPFHDASFDLVFSLYTLEHLTRPHVFLHEAVRVTKPGGRLVIVCPRYRHRHRISSLPYGDPPLLLKDRVRQLRLWSAFLHLLRRNLLFPWQVRRRFPRSSVPFLLHLRPSCLEGAYYPDNDAVYFVDDQEVLQFLLGQGAKDISREVLGGRKVRSDTCFVAVERM